ncbi:MAG: ribonuclease P [Nanoarchaeota archaeon]|nr:ribonuclease P [Nanoarchaeota archaeon]MBU1855329.1 ribonuclease P [Nanoarchaeota archaeon]
MVSKYSKKSSENLKIASERVDILFFQADEMFSENPELSDRYVSLARKIAMKFKIKLKSEYKRRFCKHCYKYLRPGVNARVRTQNGKVVYSCFSCKKFSRFPIKR